MTYKLFITYPQIAHKLIHSLGKQKVGDAFQSAQTGLYAGAVSRARKLIPSFPQVLYRLYAAYTGLIHHLSACLFTCLSTLDNREKIRDGKNGATYPGLPANAPQDYPQA